MFAVISSIIFSSKRDEKAKSRNCPYITPVLTEYGTDNFNVRSDICAFFVQIYSVYNAAPVYRIPSILTSLIALNIVNNKSILIVFLTVISNSMSLIVSIHLQSPVRKESHSFVLLYLI